MEKSEIPQKGSFEPYRLAFQWVAIQNIYDNRNVQDDDNYVDYILLIALICDFLTHSDSGKSGTL
jgi:hypothetical protein